MKSLRITVLLCMLCLPLLVWSVAAGATWLMLAQTAWANDGQQERLQQNAGPNMPAASPGGIVLVTNNNDSGPGSLRAVMGAAAPGDTVVFSLTQPATIVLTSGGIGISKSLTVSGPGSSQLTISGNNSTAIFAVNSSAVAIQGVTLRNGNAVSSYGGAILVNSGALTLTNSSVISNTAGNGGGGIAMFGTSLFISNTVFLSNTATSGGAILQVTGTINLVNSSLSSNGAEQGGAINVGNAAGHLNILNSTLGHNHALSGGNPGRGGAIESYGSVGIASSSVLSNSADVAGGAIDISGGSAAISVSSISGNSAGGGAGGIDNYGVLTVTASTISLNSTTGITTSRGGGVTVQSSGTATLQNSTVSGNSANDDGGGFYLDGGTVNLLHVTVANNTADADHDGSGRGGGISNLLAGNVNAENTIIGGNSSQGGMGPDCFGTLTSLDFNLFEDTSNCTISGTTTNNVTGQSASLAPLANYGGATATQAPRFGSPALDQIPIGTNGCGTTVTTDQRGMVRPQNGACDIGAFEGALRVLFLPLLER